MFLSVWNKQVDVYSPVRSCFCFQLKDALWLLASALHATLLDLLCFGAGLLLWFASCIKLLNVIFIPKQLIMPLSRLLLHELRYKRTSDHFFSFRPWCEKLKKKCSKKQHVWLVPVICILNLVQWSVTQVLGHVLLGGELEILSVSVLGLLYCSTDKCNWITVVHYFGADYLILAHIASYLSFCDCQH